ncbi:MAG: hypothetical protein A2X61_02610 [Ignavibacteria bacterium GWB2_35_12]|nr:MAG: hypothetical protein A2X63_11340 [Ignavibacteria bacterium GWA2_35_8]OGU42469.1 MAG: hypothetical protein A2X61_02610 [Ignavibacteria bacterium GWB2_35_12]OGU96638.1 MAG: hypothetical protein A2220_12190 [Ignavibacteria bacterium RIFOXYA2_FULL_35_10]OGV24249.1 MAG: hypothetical protein A2475_08535 [Ignavibacteria bacterium RIFOXYC2_FULL_35_21]
MNNLEDILIPLFSIVFTFGTIFGIVYLYFITRHKERLALIEKGIDAKIFMYERKPFYILMKLGLLSIGVAIGILLGNLLDATTVMDAEVAYPSMIFLFGGIALVLTYFIEKKLNKKE